jgi:hypothetical protein
MAIKNMKKIIITVTAFLAMSCSNDKEIQIVYDTIYDIETMKEWMIDDTTEGLIDKELAEWYLITLEECRNNLIILDSINKK